MPPAETPDFDSMSPEEVMAWMESLAKRQGASEGFTTSADMEIAEIDPDSVQLDEPGYVPYGEESKPRQATPPAQTPPAPPEPALPQEPVAPVASQQQALPSQAEPDPEPEQDETWFSAEIFEEITEDFTSAGMEWLESLAANQDDILPQMDLEALSAAIDDTPTQPEAPLVNPMSWLESLAENQVESPLGDTLNDITDEPATPAAAWVQSEAPAQPEADLSDIDDPLSAGVDPMLWLESLARRQGARTDELLTSADMDIPSPVDAQETGPGYTDYSVEDEPAPATTSAPVDPAAWLESMVTQSESHTAMSDQEIDAALARGEDIPPEQMEQFFNRQLDRGLSRQDVPFDDYEEESAESEPIPAELPDWLLDQVQPPDQAPLADTNAPALIDEIIEPPNVEDLPDWLKDDIVDEDNLNLENIFETTAETAAPPADPDIDNSDPWVQAFEEEAATDPDSVPEWYEQNLRDPERIAAVEQQFGPDEAETGALIAASLPEETTLASGQQQPMPDWLTPQDSIPEAITADTPDWLSEAAPVATDEEALPAWLSDTDAEINPEEIPQWLRDTLETEEAQPAQQQPIETITAPAAPQASQPQQTAASQAAAIVSTAAASASDLLNAARLLVQSGDLVSSLNQYEQVIRANESLDDVVSDLAGLAQQNPEEPALYRVLGDGLMRQGRLQEALDTYRKALNQL